MRNSWAPNTAFAPEDELVVVVGGCGHVGLPLAVACSEAYNTVGLDINFDSVEACNRGEVPFKELGLKQALDYSLNTAKSLHFSDDGYWLGRARYIAITIGTPVDEEGNARLDDIQNFFKNILLPILSMRGHDRPVYVMLRSTVSPGTTEILNELMKSEKAPKNVHLAFCPERVLQGRAYMEFKSLPQIVGFTTYTDERVRREFIEFYRRLDVQYTVEMTATEAEVAKLVTNMTRYVEFALANEFYILGDKFRVNIDKVITGAKSHYPRLQGLAKPGPNVGGPCLFKDGKFLLKNSPFNGLIATSFAINEGMPQYIFDKAIALQKNGPGYPLQKIGILGMTFKADNDDTRNSLSFKLKKIAKTEGLSAFTHDPFLLAAAGWDSADIYQDLVDNLKECQVVFLMTPHTWYLHHPIEEHLSDCTVVADAWKHLPKSKLTKDGVWIHRK